MDIGVTLGKMKNVAADSDPYLPLLRKHWDALTGMYVAFADRAPMLEFNVESGQILIYPAGNYLEELGSRTREEAKEQYKNAVAEGALMVFVRDESRKILRSYIFAPAKESSMRATRKKRGAGVSNRRGYSAVEGRR